MEIYGARHCKCPECGEMFWRTAQHGYWIAGRGNTKVYYCSWTCYRKAEQRRESEKQAKLAARREKLRAYQKERNRQIKEQADANH